MQMRKSSIRYSALLASLLTGITLAAIHTTVAAADSPVQLAQGGGGAGGGGTGGGSTGGTGGDTGGSGMGGTR